jgi:hypothetical protein
MKRTDEHRHDEHRHDEGHVEPSPRLVDRDVNLRAVGLTVLSILGLTIVAAALMWWLLAAFLSGAEAADPRPGPAAASAPRELPPGPRLQARPEADLLRMRAREELILSSYGWTEDGGVRIPIERAIDALAARGGAAAVGTSETAPEAAPIAGGGDTPGGDGGPAASER